LGICGSNGGYNPIIWVLGKGKEGKGIWGPLNLAGKLELSLNSKDIGVRHNLGDWEIYRGGKISRKKEFGSLKLTAYLWDCAIFFKGLEEMFFPNKCLGQILKIVGG